MSRIELVFERLHVAVQEQMAALESCPDPARWPVLGAYLRCTIDRLDRVAVLIVVRATRGRSLVSQRSIAAKLDALHGRAEALLAGIQHGDDMETRRFATRLAALDPLASARSGPDGLVDLSEKVVTGVPISAARRYCTEDGGPLAASHAFLAGVTIRDADLRMAQLSRTRLLDLDARGVRLDGATAIEAQLARVNLAEASMQDADMQAILARDCDFSGASLAYARWDGATAIRCSFNRAELADLSADRAVFLDCDFRGADLAVGELGAPITMTGAQSCAAISDGRGGAIARSRASASSDASCTV